MKTKKIIIILLVVCLLGGLLTFNGSASGWLYETFSDIGTAFLDGYRSLFSRISFWATGDLEALNNLKGGFKDLVTSPARVWTTINCSFISYQTLIEFQGLLTRGGIHSSLTLQYDKNDTAAFFLIVVSVDNEELSDIVGQVLYLQNKYAAAINDNSSAIGGGMGGGGISGGGGGGRRGNAYMNDFASDDNANSAYVDIETITGNEEIKEKTDEIIIYNNFDNTKTEINNIVNFEDKTVYHISNDTYYNFETIEYNGDTLSYDISYVNNNVTEEIHIAYYVNYTVVNYVDLEDTYVLYYELPDGRNSYDMTVEELSQYSGSFDVINYVASTDNSDLFALYPFDGNQENIAYGDSPLTWTTGNSITYLPVEGFGAALYLGNGTHTFESGIYADKFYESINAVTTSFRYYVSEAVTENQFTIDFLTDFSSTALDYLIPRIIFTGSTVQIALSSGTPSGGFPSASYTLPYGQWVNVAVTVVPQAVFSGSSIKPVFSVYVFINGLSVYSYSYSSNSSYNNSADRYSNSNIRYTFYNGTDRFCYIDELVIMTDSYFGETASANFTPSLQPYDTNLILTLPSLQAVTVDSYIEDGKTYYYVYTPDQLWKPTIAVATDIPITQYYLGGVRPSLPKRGYVWVPIQGGVIGTVQYYDGSGWQETGSRVWTGSRWVESSNYNIRTNGTYTDLAETVPLPVISDEQGFWAWCVSSFDTLIETIKGSGGGGGGTVADPDVIPDIVVPGVDDDGNETEDSFSLFDIAKDALGGVVKIIGKVIGLGGDVGSFFNDFADGIGDTFDVLNPNNQNGLFWVEVSE